MPDTGGPGPLLARGGDADVFAIDEPRVLRRYRRRAVPEREGAIMRYVRDRGYPAPRVIEVSGPDLVLERIDGPTMLADLSRRPWRFRTHALTLRGSTVSCTGWRHRISFAARAMRSCISTSVRRT